MPYTLLASGMFMSPGMSLMGLKSRMLLVSRETVFSVSYLKKIWEYL